MNDIPDDVKMFFSIDGSSNNVKYHNKKIFTMFSKNALDNIVSEVYHGLFEVYGTIPWVVVDYVSDSIKTCAREKLWDKSIDLNLLYNKNAFVLKYYDNTKYFKNPEINNKYLKKNKKTGLFYKSDIISIDNNSGSIYFGLKKDNNLFLNTPDLEDI